MFVKQYQLAQRCSMLNVIYHIVSVTCSLLPICWNPLKMLLKNTKKARTELSYRDIWETFKNLMDYIEFFDMGTPQRLLKKSANEWFGTNHELSRKSDKIKREYVRELKRIFQILLNHQALEVLGTVNVVVDEVCGEGTWAKYTIRYQRWTEGCEKREAIALEKARKEEEVRNKTLEERIQMWKSGEISQLSYYCWFENDQPNVWLRIKNGKIESVAVNENPKKIDEVKW